MTNDDKYNHTCLVEGDKNAFPIVISFDADIDQLTVLIYEKRKRAFFVISILRTSLFRRSTSSCHIDVVDCPADQLVSQVEINLSEAISPNLD